MTSRIVILGWGSLLWDKHPDFDSLHDEWRNEGPLLKLEFSRISKSRNGALTLVIDAENGAPTAVAYCLSKRTAITDVIADLQRREKSPTSKHVAYMDLITMQESFANKEAAESIQAWAKKHDLSGVVWTDLPSNFQSTKGEPFSIAAALSHLNGLDSPMKKKAMEYITRAPKFVHTPLRNALAE